MSITLERVETRAGYIAGLRMLADLLEAQPDVPIYHHGVISFSLGSGMPEMEAFEAIDRAAAALEAAGIPFEHEANEHHRAIEFQLAGLVYRFGRVTDTAWDAHQARHSYEPNVQVA